MMHFASSSSATSEIIRNGSYNNKDAAPYLKLRNKNRFLQGENKEVVAKEDANKDVNKEKDVMKEVPDGDILVASPTLSPTKSPTQAPTPSPTSQPTFHPSRAPVVSPWKEFVTDYVSLKISIFTKRKARVGTNEIDGRSLLSADNLKSAQHEDLVENVVTSMATVICEGVGNRKLGILSYEEGKYYNFCPMIAAGDTESQSDFEIIPDGLPTVYSYALADIKNRYGLLDIEDRKVFVSNNGDTSGDYLEWTVWSLDFPVIKLGSSLNGSWEADLAGIQNYADRALSLAISDNTINESLQSMTPRHYITTSSEGFEVDTFLSFMEKIDDNDDMTVDDGVNDFSEYTFWQPIRITGMLLLFFLIAFVWILMKIGHERYKYDVWDATVDKKSKRGGVETANHVNISTFEGLDFVLHSGHQMRKKADTNAENIPMDMGNTKSEIAGTAAASPSTPSPRKRMRDFLMSRIGYECSNSECVAAGDEYSLISVQKKGAGDTTTRSLLPPREDDECAQEVEIIMTPERKPNHVPAEKTPDNAERIRERNGDYAFVSVTTKMFK